MEDFKYIKKIEIKGLWSKFDINWKLNPDVNVLSGINGSGKSTILRLIDNVLSNEIYTNNHNLGNIKSVSISSDNMTLKYSDDIFKSTFLTGNEKIKYNFIKSVDKQLLSKEEAKKLTLIVGFTVKTELDAQLASLIIRYERYRSNIVSILSQAIKEKSNKELKELEKQTNKWNNLFVDSVNKLFAETNKTLVNNNGLSFYIDNVLISPDLLSTGEKQLLIILLTTLLQEGKPAILLMDEPEISLHTDWQKQLISVIRELNPNVQIILATHSPSIIMKGWLDKVTNVSQITNNIAK